MPDKWLLYRWWKLWKQDVREGWEILGRYRVGCTCSVILQENDMPYSSPLCLPCKMRHALSVASGE